MAIRPRTKNHAPTLPEVTISEDGEVRFLHLGTEWIQGSMLIDKPFDIELEYVQRMMAWLLFVDLDTVAQRHAMQLGLGSAALTKFHFKKLKMATTAIEINPQVVATCRTWFKLPPDNDKLSVILGDAAQVVQHVPFYGTVDALQVDVYDHEAAGPVLDSLDFYSDCRRMLADDGCMTVNLFGRHASYDRSLDHIKTAFGLDAVWVFKPTREGNAIVLAQRTPKQPTRMQLLLQAETIEDRWSLPATKWLRVFKPLLP
jgi:spermidine synthase